MVKFTRIEEYKTVNETAAMLGLTPNTVSQQLRIEKLYGEKIEGKWFVPVSEVERYAEKHLGTRKPKTKKQEASPE